MSGVWRRDRHEVKAIGSLPFRIEHFPPRAVGPVFGQAQTNPIRATLCRIDIHGPR